MLIHANTMKAMPIMLLLQKGPVREVNQQSARREKEVKERLEAAWMLIHANTIKAMPIMLLLHQGVSTGKYHSTSCNAELPKHRLSW